jgi:hypothetical protein
MNTTTADSRIVMRIGQGSLSLAALDTSSRIIDYAAHNMKSGISTAANLREAFKSVSLLAMTYGWADVMLASPTMLIPHDEFHEEEAATMYDHTFSGYERSVKICNPMNDLNAVAVCSVDKDVQTVIGDHFQNARLLPVCLPVWQHLHQQGYEQTRQRLYAYFHDSMMDVFCFSQHRFKFCNAFQTTQAQDALYFLLYAFSQLGLKGERDAISVIGGMPQKKWLIERLRTYVAEVSAPEAKDTGLPEMLRWPSVPYDMQVFINQSTR